MSDGDEGDEAEEGTGVVGAGGAALVDAFCWKKRDLKNVRVNNQKKSVKKKMNTTKHKGYAVIFFACLNNNTRNRARKRK